MIVILFQSILFMVPAYFANMVPSLTRNLNFLNYPVDFRFRLGKKRIFGNHKTFRGFFFGILSSVICIYILRYFYVNFTFVQNLSLIDYTAYNPFFLGFLFGFGALFGDLIESFFKRRLNVKPGKPLVFFDQSDYVIGTLLLVSFVYVPTLIHVFAMFVLSTTLHFLTVFIGYHLRLSPVKI